MKRLLFLVALAALAAIPSFFAQQPNRQGGNRQNPPTNQNNQNRSPAPQSVVVWRAELPSGSYEVARGAILAISSHQYILDGAARVTEVNITTAGPFQPRFYYLEPLVAAAAEAVPGGRAIADQVQAQGQDAVNGVISGDPVWTKVVKNYPTTTHAGTIEFRLETRDQLDKLFDSVERTWMSGKSETYTPAGAQSYRAKKKSEEANGDEQDASSPGDTGPAAN